MATFWLIQICIVKKLNIMCFFLQLLLLSVGLFCNLQTL